MSIPASDVPEDAAALATRRQIMIALRVLNAQAANVPVDPQDVAELRSWAPAAEAQNTPDQLALSTLQRILKRKRRRGPGSARNRTLPGSAMSQGA